MNNYLPDKRKRSQTLLIVEGNHEKNKLFWLIFKCFPEINIDIDNVWIYGTNIYLLYEDIVSEYGSDWAEEEIDVDFPFVISKKQTPDNVKYKYDFTNIIMVFDYERHDTNFSEKKILYMQNIFCDATDMGKLYINYPMIESYLHLKSIPDAEYLLRKIQVSLQPGKRYKELVEKDSVISGIIDLPHRIDDLMNKNFGVTDIAIREKCVEKILSIYQAENIEQKLEDILYNVIEDNRLKTLKYQLKDWINKAGYIHNEQSYWQYVRNLFKDIIQHNIYKANYIQNNLCESEIDKYKNYFNCIDLTQILNIQNSVSENDVEGFIWVLSTCLFLIPDYNWKLISE